MAQSPSPHRLISGRAFFIRLLASVLLVNLFVAGLAVFSLVRSRQQYEERVAIQTQNLAQSLNLTITGMIDNAGLAVFTVKREAERQLKNGGIDIAFLNAFILEHKARIPELDGLRVTNAQGDIICGDRVEPGKPVNFSDREVFIRLKADPKAGLAIGPPVHGRLTRHWVFHIAQRIHNQDGSFAGIVFGAISVEYLSQLFSTFDSGRQGALTLRNGDLSVIVRYPDIPGKSSIGSNVVSRELRQLVREGRTSGSYKTPGSIDSIERTFSFNRLSKYPLYVTAGLATNEYLAPWHAEARQMAWLVGIFSCGFLLFSWLIYRVRKREKAVEAEITRHRDYLEEKVRLRTSALEANNIRLAEEIELRKRVEDDLRKAAVIMNKLSDAVCWISREGTYVYVNDAACSMHGYSRDEMLSMSVWDIACHFPAESWPGHWEQLKNEGSLHFETLNRARDGREFPVEVAANHLDIDGIEYNCGIIRDISDRKQAEAEKQELLEQLGQSQKIESIGRLAGGIAHDFNNLLTPILGYSELLKNDIPITDPGRGKIELILQAADKARILTQQLLSFGRKQILEMKIVDMNEVVTNFHEILRRTIRESIDIRLHLTGQACGIKADRNQLEQVILNLAINAQDAISDRGVITIETAQVRLDQEYARQHAGVVPGEYLMLAVTDNGSGMNREIRAQIFEPFFTTKEVGKGSGLGLATVYGLVKQHEGHIWVYSELGTGTVFKIYFPIVGGRPANGLLSRAESAVLSSGAGTILLVEDNEMVRNLTTDLLDKCGYQVIVADGPESALTASVGRTVDLLLTDVVMPGMNGPELHQKLLEGHCELKVLYMSGYTNNVIVHHGVLEEGINFIQKPFSLHDLALKIDTILNGHRCGGPADEPSCPEVCGSPD
ncbi:hybrid sensor histidine kinase/response regulator [Geobacter sp. SVR]|uniref:hybrid sensor histidine kinase/response regulator n=1 Tax=Geobacter sp. SVR TaxID=2495594 RepID=UPI00143F005C|nr:hybrid sensor histidine kinase/response regulator [Geobacter sp. SVR]BCS54629.1 hypothetical protein GSVR_29370 [Geobacter sp. SVR]GCF86863.1 hypothetical protein GSbR_34630 [Geobacter sp. SVR]